MSEDKGFKRDAVKGVSWTGLSAAVAGACQLLQYVILARLIAPEAFGLMAMAMVFVGFATAFSDMGINNGLIYRRDTTKNQLDSLYWLNLAFGLLTFLGLLALTPAVVAFFGEERLGSVFPWVAACFLILPIGQQYRILLQKNLCFRFLAITEIFGAIAALGVAVGLAAVGQGVFALVWGMLANVTVRTSILTVRGLRDWRPRLRFDRRDLKGYLKFGLFQTGDRTVNEIGKGVDKLIIGSLFGAQVLGYYSLAWNLVMLPLTKINPVINKVAFPLYAKIQDDIPRLRQGYFLTIRLLSLITLPVFVGMAVTASVFVPVIFGNEWGPAVIFVQILSIIALLRALANPVGSLLYSQGRADLGFRFSSLKLFLQVPVLLTAAYLSNAVGLAIAYALMQVFYFALGYRMLVRRILGPCLGEYLHNFRSSFLLSSAMGGSVLLLHIVGKSSPSFPFLAGMVLLGVAVYLVLLYCFERTALAFLLDGRHGSGPRLAAAPDVRSG